ncbi:MAG TPA: PaaI family thioesterase [Pyrinomonadaceae bacterium]|nr:PaaI family thioesterase [Pyrinomonadaceae bacterium]
MKTRFEPQDPHFAERIQQSFARQHVMRLIGASLTVVEPGMVEIEIPTREDLTQQDGFMHAGIVTTVLDSACGYAAYTLMPAGSSVLSVEFKVNLLAPAMGDLVVARAEVKRFGKTLTVCAADAFADGKICATMLATMICREAKPDKN